jgi:hypothetical protein
MPPFLLEGFRSTMTGTLLVLALSAFTSATLLPGTSEATLLVLAAGGAAPGWLLVAVAGSANTAGSVVNWWLGRFASRFAGRRWFPASPAQIERASNFYRRFGWASLLLSWLRSAHRGSRADAHAPAALCHRGRIREDRALCGAAGSLLVPMIDEAPGHSDIVRQRASPRI